MATGSMCQKVVKFGHLVHHCTLHPTNEWILGGDVKVKCALLKEFCDVCLLLTTTILPLTQLKRVVMVVGGDGSNSDIAEQKQTQCGAVDTTTVLLIDDDDEEEEGDESSTR